MSNGIMAISELVKKCKILLLDIEGTTTSISFVKDKLFPYAEENVKKYLEAQWEKDDVKEAVVALRKLAVEDKEGAIDGVVDIPGEDATKEEQIQGLVDSVKWLMSKDRKSGALKQLQGLIWKQGYDNGDIKGHIYDDVSPAMELWRSVDGQKIYIYSSGSVQAQKLLFGQSTAGDLLPMIDGHFDTAVGAKREAASYTAIVEKIGCKADDILFLTDIVEEAEAAKSAGVQTALVDREGGVVSATFPVITSMAQLVGAQKRKPDEQSDEPAPKVAKTETEVKEKPAETSPEVSSVAEKEVPEKMEVEDSASETSTDVKEKEEEKVVDKVEVAEVKDLNEANKVPISKAETVVTEEKTDDNAEKKEEKMETDSNETVTPTAETKSDKIVNDNKIETSEITEIKEIPSDEPIPQGTEVVDIKPVVEEPAVTDADELKTAGEALEKECGDILSKVEDVTNIDNIPGKPLLNSIAEETMETENNDSTETETEKKVPDVKDVEKTDENKISNESTTAQDKKEDDTSSKVPEEKPAQDNTTEIKDSATKTEETANEVNNSEPETKTSDENNKATETKTSDEDNKATETKTSDEDIKPAETKTVDNDNKPTETKTIDGDNKPTETAVPIEKPVDAIAENGKADHTENNSAVEEKIEQKSEVSEKITNGTQSEENKDSVVESKDEEKKSEADLKEPQMNGNATNGDSTKMNGNDKEVLNDRLTENGVGAVNGSNGNDDKKIEGNGDSKAETEVTEIKVKTVADVEERTEPIEQATEA